MRPICISPRKKIHMDIPPKIWYDTVKLRRVELKPVFTGGDPPILRKPP